MRGGASAAPSRSEQSKEAAGHGRGKPHLWPWLLLEVPL